MRRRLIVTLLLIGFVCLVGKLALVHAHERIHAVHDAVIREDRAAVQGAIAAYTEDLHKPPRTLQDLIDTGYLKSIPRNVDLQTNLPLN